MELRRAADAALRSQSSPLAAFLTPSVSSRWRIETQSKFTAISKSSRRNLSSSSRRSAGSSLYPSTTTSAEKSTEEEGKQTPEQIAESLNWLNAGVGGNKTRTSRFSSPNAQAENRATSPNANRPSFPLNPGGNSASDILRELNFQRQNRQSNRFDADRMQQPPSAFGSAALMRNLGDDLAARGMPQPQKIPMRLSPKTGRTIELGAGLDVGRGFRLLEQSCARNKVRNDFTKQRFHERGGLKRKRLVRERWRKRFMLGFKATVARVKELKKQGW